ILDLEEESVTVTGQTQKTSRCLRDYKDYKRVDWEHLECPKCGQTVHSRERREPFLTCMLKSFVETRLVSLSFHPSSQWYLLPRCGCPASRCHTFSPVWLLLPRTLQESSASHSQTCRAERFAKARFPVSGKRSLCS